MKGLFKFRWGKKHEDFCLNHHIYLQHVMKVKGVYSPRNLLLFKRGSKLSIGKNVIVEEYATMPLDSFCSMGSFSYSASTLPSDMKVGRFCSIAPNVNIMGTQHPTNRFTSSPLTYNSRFVDLVKRDFHKDYDVIPFEMELQPPIVGHDVWIGENSTLKGGITIGHGAIIASNSVVTKDVPPYAIVGGIPAKIIKYRFDENTIQRLLTSKWWDYHITDLPSNLYSSDVNLFLDELVTNLSRGNTVKYNYKKFNLSETFSELSQ